MALVGAPCCIHARAHPTDLHRLDWEAPEIRHRLGLIFKRQVRPSLLEAWHLSQLPIEISHLRRPQPQLLVPQLPRRRRDRLRASIPCSKSPRLRDEHGIGIRAGALALRSRRQAKRVCLFPEEFPQRRTDAIGERRVERLLVRPQLVVETLLERDSREGRVERVVLSVQRVAEVRNGAVRVEDRPRRAA